jgi:glutamyl-tRNA reductase
VSMTLRRKMHKDDEQSSIMPAGCKMLPYDERMAQVPQNQVVVSATISPHYTITQKQFLENNRINFGNFKENRIGEKSQYFFDLAVPRDIDAAIGYEDGVVLYDIDSMGSTAGEAENSGVLLEAKKIIENYVTEFIEWMEFRDNLPQIKEVIELFEEDFRERLNFIGKTEKIEEEKIKSVLNAGSKVITKLVFETLKELDEKNRDASLEALKKSGMRKSLRH